MRALALLVPLALVSPACGGDDGGGPSFTPAIIPGGGIHDPGLDGPLAVYVIDGESDEPIAGATVHVGDASVTTDATGLALFADVTGPQTVAATAPSHATALWVGVDGANVTIPLDRSPADARPPQAQLTGSITGWSELPPPDPDHVRIALVTFSIDPTPGTHANDIVQPPATGLPTASCLRTRGGSATCNWKLNARAGALALGLVMIDVDNRGTGDTTDDVAVFSGYSVTPITVVDRMNQSGVMLALPPAESGVRPTVALGTPPASLPQVSALVGLDLGAAGVFRVNGLDPTRPGALVPSLALAAGSSYELIGVATEPSTDGTAAQSVVRRRGLTDPAQLSLAGWLAPPTAVASDRASVSFSGAAGGLTVVEIDNAALGVEGRRVMSIAILDGSSQVAIPPAVALPRDPLTVRVTTLDPGAPVDLTDFEAEAVLEGVVAAASDTVALP